MQAENEKIMDFEKRLIGHIAARAFLEGSPLVAINLQEFYDTVRQDVVWVAGWENDLIESVREINARHKLLSAANKDAANNLFAEIEKFENCLKVKLTDEFYGHVMLTKGAVLFSGLQKDEAKNE